MGIIKHEDDTYDVVINTANDVFETLDYILHEYGHGKSCHESQKICNILKNAMDEIEVIIDS